MSLSKGKALFGGITNEDISKLESSWNKHVQPAKNNSNSQLVTDKYEAMATDINTRRRPSTSRGAT